MKLENKVAVITGASSGIGRATAIMLGKKCVKLVLVARNADRLDEVLQKVSIDTKAIRCVCDVASESDVASMAQQVRDKLGEPDILINNAGFAIYGSVEELSASDIRAQMETNYFGAMHCVKEFLPQMLARRSGKIVNVASVAASFGLPGIAAYCASKFAMLGFSEALRSELAGTNVSITVVSPIAVKTPFFDHKSFKNIPRYSPMSLGPDKVAEAIIRAINSNRAEIMVPSIARIAVWIKHTFPQIIDAFVVSKFKNTLKKSH